MPRSEGLDGGGLFPEENKDKDKLELKLKKKREKKPVQVVKQDMGLKERLTLTHRQAERPWTEKKDEAGNESWF